MEQKGQSVRCGLTPSMVLRSSPLLVRAVNTVPLPPMPVVPVRVQSMTVIPAVPLTAQTVRRFISVWSVMFRKPRPSL